MNPWWLLAGLAVFLIGITKSGFGAGVGLMIVPLMAIALDGIPGRGSEAALGLLLPLLIAGDIVAVWQYRRLFSGRTVLRILPGTMAGVVLGGLLLQWFRSHAAMVGALIRIEIGIESILLVGLHWWRSWRGVQERLVPEPWRSGVTGCFAGISSTLAHAAGPILAMYLLPLRLDRRLFVGTNAVYFGVLNAAKLPAYVLAGQFARTDVPLTIGLLPLVAAGGLAGFWLNRRMDDRLFSRVVYAITFVLGWYILADGVGKLVVPTPA